MNQMLDFTFGNAAKAIRITGHRELQGSDRLRTPSVVVPGMQTCFAGRHSADADGIADITLPRSGRSKAIECISDPRSSLDGNLIDVPHGNAVTVSNRSDRLGGFLKLVKRVLHDGTQKDRRAQ